MLKWMVQIPSKKGVGQYRDICLIGGSMSQAHLVLIRVHINTPPLLIAMRIAGVICPPPPNSGHGGRPLFKVAGPSEARQGPPRTTMADAANWPARRRTEKHEITLTTSSCPRPH